MGLPSKKRPRSEKGGRAAHLKLVPPTLARCANCGKATLPHTACPSCGFYGGRKVLEIETLDARKKRREEQAKKRHE